MNSAPTIHPLIQKAYAVLDGHPLDKADALAIAHDIHGADLLDLISLANKVRLKFAPGLHTCSIINAKSGKCRENCRFCAQSAYHSTGIDTYPVLAPEEVLKAARKAYDEGVRTFGYVTSGRGWSKPDAEFRTILDTLDLLQNHAGFISREYQRDGKVYWSSRHPVAFAPPLLAWAELELFRAGVSDAARLRRVCPALRRHHSFCRNHYRRDDGLYFGDALGCGMDDLPRMPLAPRPELAHAGIDFKLRFILADDKKMWNYINGNPLYSWNRQMGWIDMSSQMALDAESLAGISEAIGHHREAARFRAEHDELARRINECCWDEASGFYFDCCEGAVIPRFHAGGFWPMIAGIVPPERAGRIVETLKNPAIFDRLVPLASLGANDPGFDPENGYWRGAVWPPTVYIALLGLRRIGAEAAAGEFARRVYNAYAELFRTTGGFWENISCEQFDHPKARSNGEHCGWSLLIPVNLRREFLS